MVACSVELFRQGEAEPSKPLSLPRPGQCPVYHFPGSPAPSRGGSIYPDVVFRRFCRGCQPPQVQGRAMQNVQKDNQYIYYTIYIYISIQYIIYTVYDMFVISMIAGVLS